MAMGSYMELYNEPLHKLHLVGLSLGALMSWKPGHKKQVDADLSRTRPFHLGVGVGVGVGVVRI